MKELRNQLKEFYKGCGKLSTSLEEINSGSGNSLNSEISELSNLLHHIEYFLDTGTPDEEIRGKLDEVEEEYDRRSSENLRQRRESARKEINKLIRSQSR